MVFLIVRIEGIEGTAKPLIGLLTLLGLPRLVLQAHAYAHYYIIHLYTASAQWFLLPEVFVTRSSSVCPGKLLQASQKGRTAYHQTL